MHFSRFVHIFRQEPGHILRQRGCYRQAAAGDGVGQLQPVGVQGRAGDQGSVLGAVEPVPQQGVADSRQVQPQLVGAAGAGGQPQQGPVRPLPQGLIVRVGRQTRSRPMGRSMDPAAGLGTPLHTAR